MKLIVGGYVQGKLEYVCEQWHIEESMVYDGKLPEQAEDEVVIVNHFHKWMKKRMEECGNPEEEIRTFVDNYPKCIIISDELGNGIVPVDSFEREYRERTGRILIELAKRAEEVERVICGMGQKLK